MDYLNYLFFQALDGGSSGMRAWVQRYPIGQTTHLQNIRQAWTNNNTGVAVVIICEGSTDFEAVTREAALIETISK